MQGNPGSELVVTMDNDERSELDRLDLDEDGHLADRSLWSEAVAISLAARDGIDLGEQHWTIIRFVQVYYDEYELAPSMRVLVKAMRQRLGEDWASSRPLYRLFPESPARQACLYAGLPKPVGCI